MPPKPSSEHWTSSSSDSLPQDSSQEERQAKGKKNRKRRGRGRAKMDSMAQSTPVKTVAKPASGATAKVAHQAVGAARSRVSGGNLGAASGAQHPHRAQQGSQAARQAAEPGPHHPHRSSAGAQGASPAQAVRSRTHTTPALGAQAIGRPRGGPTQQPLPAGAPVTAARTQAAPRAPAWAQGAPRPTSVFGAPQEEVARLLVGERLEGLEAMKRRCAGNKALQHKLATLQSRTGLQRKRYIRGELPAASGALFPWDHRVHPKLCLYSLHAHLDNCRSTTC